MTLNKTDKLRSLERRRGSVPVARYQTVHGCGTPVAGRDLLDADLPSLQRCTSYSSGGPQRESWASGSSDSVISSSGSDTDTCLHRVVLLGGHGVGRSSLAHIFGGVDDSEAGERANMFDRTILVDDEEANLIVFDIWQQDESSQVQEHCMKLGDAYAIVYSVTDRGSFDRASELRIQLRRARQAEDIPIILVGNKTDLVRSREVSVDEGRACAVVFDCKFIETSAALHHNVTNLFEGIVRQIRLRTDSKEDNQRRLACTKRRQSLGQKAKRFLGKLAAKNNKKMAFKQKSKSCHDLSVL